MTEVIKGGKADVEEIRARALPKGHILKGRNGCISGDLDPLARVRDGGWITDTAP